MEHGATLGDRRFSKTQKNLRGASVAIAHNSICGYRVNAIGLVVALP